MKIFSAKRADTKLSELNRGEVFEFDGGPIYMRTENDANRCRVCEIKGGRDE